jgi:hypothetical protein
MKRRNDRRRRHHDPRPTGISPRRYVGGLADDGKPLGEVLDAHVLADALAEIAA